MQEFVESIRHHSRLLVRELDVLKGVFQDTGLTYSQCHALFEIDRENTLTTMEVAESLQLDKSTASRVLSSLQEDGLADMRPGEADRRQKHFQLTEKGKVATARNNRLANRQVTDALLLLTAEERQTVLDGLRLYAKALRQSRQQQAFIIRPIQEADNPQVARLIREVMTEFGTVGEGYSIMDPEVDRMYETYKGRSSFFVIEQQGAIQGCGGIGPLTGGPADVCELKKMYFYPSLRGLGFGKRLVDLCLQAALEYGYRRCYLETVDRMWQANLLYQRAGFERLSQPMGNTGHSSCEAYYIREL
ncbi:MAG: bifunctional helix-turn-helix transcriptional regulator/GNAT family N-acetyltransferase [Saprospiraceae bacterium]|nr:bifunctional helix-turn-helix transcriptional regulator/GNAT family N-acetyltransferase [Saprospiraceae bacterium]